MVGSDRNNGRDELRIFGSIRGLFLPLPKYSSREQATVCAVPASYYTARLITADPPPPLLLAMLFVLVPLPARMEAFGRGRSLAPK